VSLIGGGETIRYPAGDDPVSWDFYLEADESDWRCESAFWLMWFSQRAFAADHAFTEQELAEVGFDQLRIVSVRRTGLQALIARHSERGIVVAFRGTADFYGWCTDLNLRMTALEDDDAVKVHPVLRMHLIVVGRLFWASSTKC
jgi:hypothetical protein